MVSGPPPLPLPDEHRSVDQVMRAREFVRRHPHVSITTPRQNGSGEFRASWHEDCDGPSQDGVVRDAHHYDLRCLLDYLEARYDR